MQKFSPNFCCPSYFFTHSKCFLSWTELILSWICRCSVSTFLDNQSCLPYLFNLSITINPLQMSLPCINSCLDSYSPYEFLFQRLYFVNRFCWRYHYSHLQLKMGLYMVLCTFISVFFYVSFLFFRKFWFSAQKVLFRFLQFYCFEVVLLN